MILSELYPILLKHPVVSTDSRNCPQGALFFALRGEKFDGNDYIASVLQNGAAYAVGDRNDLPPDDRIIVVDDVLQTLQDLANHHRKQLPATIIAITGTNGKTTAKELIANALSTSYQTLFTQGNLNNHIGVPLTLLQLKPEHRFAVIEMGASHPGEIEALCRIAEPDFGLITNVGKAHLEGFGSFEGVIRAKSELYDFLNAKGGSVFVNHDNPILTNVLTTAYPSLRRIEYGTSRETFVYGKMTETDPTLELEWGESTIKTHLVGGYNFENAMAAICVASYLGVEKEKISRAIAGYVPTNNRSQNLQTDKNHLIVDAYNANPSSMQLALSNFLSLNVSPQMVILGEMRELGDYSQEEHQQLVDYLSASRLDRVILCGENFSDCRSIASEWQVFSHTGLLLNYLQTAQISGFHILIKGSRSNQLEKTIEYL